MNGFGLGFMLGCGFGLFALIYIIAMPVLLEHIRHTIAKRLDEMDEEDDKK